jgi:hypothetical protein
MTKDIALTRVELAPSTLSDLEEIFTQIDGFVALLQRLGFQATDTNEQSALCYLASQLGSHRDRMRSLIETELQASRGVASST